jgi:ribosomal protein S18 acetylase RimI-like enzyme
MFVIRGASPADARGIARVHATVWKDRYRGMLDAAYLNSLTEARLATGWRRTIEQLPGQLDEAILVAAVGSKIAGFVSVGASREAFCPWDAEISMIYVLREHARSGVGRALMKAAADHSIRRGMFSGGLWVLKANADARAFYQRLGGEVAGRKQDMVGGKPVALVGYAWRELAQLAERSPPQVIIGR